jgi:hypothetical protein
MLMANGQRMIRQYAPKLASLDAAKILRIHGYRDINLVRKDVRGAAERHAEEALKLLKLRFFYQKQPVAGLSNGQLVLGCGTKFECEAFGKILRNSEEVVPFLLSTGKPIDNQIQAYLADFGVLEALFLETAGWIAIEAATRMFALHLRRETTPDGLVLSTRMGPGYAYNLGNAKVTWDLRDQRKLFSLFDGYPLPVKLLDSCAMYPKLSRSGLFGLLRRPEERRRNGL